MNLLITGASGFIGLNLLNELKLIEDDYENIYLLTNKIIPGYKCINYDSYNFNNDLFKNINSIETVIHLGAFIPKSNNEKDIINLCSSNITSTISLIEKLPNTPTKFIYISTIDVYGNSEIIDENSTINPISLYAYSKLYCEEVLKTWAYEKNVCLQILRLGHIYGQGEENYKKIIPTSIKKIIINDDIELYNNGEEKRSFLNIKDCCMLILNSLKLDKFVGPINVVSAASISIKDLIQLLFHISKKSVNITKTNKITKVRNVKYNNEKMIKYLGNESISLNQGLKEEYEYFYKIINERENFKN